MDSCTFLRTMGFCQPSSEKCSPSCVFWELTSCFKAFHFLLPCLMFLLIFSLKHWGNADTEMNPAAFVLWGLFGCFWGRGTNVWFFRSHPRIALRPSESPVEAERFQKGLDAAKLVGVTLLEESPLFFLIRFDKWKLTLPLLHHSLEEWAILYPMLFLHLLSNQLEVIVSFCLFWTVINSRRGRPVVKCMEKYVNIVMNKPPRVSRELGWWIGIVEDFL